MKIEDSNRKGKRFVAIFANGEKIHFGQRGGNTYIDHGDIKKRAAYLARHGTDRENWKTPYTPASLSRWILWGPYTQLGANVAFFKNMFRI
jgi:hypothetical protein